MQFLIHPVVERLALLMLVATLAPVYVANAAEQGRAGNELTDTELMAETPQTLPSISASEVDEFVLSGVVEFGYEDEKGRFVVDMLEQDRAYLGVKVTTPEGQPVSGAMPDISIQGSSRLLLTEIVSGQNGVMNFGVVAGEMGLDTVTASVGDVEVEFLINVISLRAAGYPEPVVVEGAISWTDLMSAKLDFTETGMIASFPKPVADKSGELVKISGFMMPLQPDIEQSHFLLTSNPPSCFFHIPGGPAGSVEVLAAEGIEVSWNPIVVEGRFEPLETSEYGVVYRLTDAKLVNP